MLDVIDENIRAKEKKEKISLFSSKKTYYCRQCEAKLENQQEELRSFEFSVSRDEVPAFQVQLQIPAVMCLACGAHNVIEANGLETDIIDAQTEALSSIPNL
jgi:RNase P subunit RPR2